MVDPPLRPIIQALAAQHEVEVAAPTVEERRAGGEATMLLIRPAPVPGIAVADHEVAVAGGTIAVRVSRPEAPHLLPTGHRPGDPLPAYVYAHGGGWMTGTLDTAEVECGPVAHTVGCVVVSIGYRRAPEHPFPTPLEDCVAAYRWALDHAADLGLDPERVAVGGTSAGANLMAAACLVLRDRGLPLPCLQVLEAPCCDLTLPDPSATSSADGPGLTRADVEAFAAAYLAGGDPTDPYASPRRAPDLAGLPPALVVTAEHDLLRDDGEAYLAALREAGVPAAGLRLPGHLHGTWIIPGTMTAGLVDDVRTATLRRAFAGGLPAGGLPAGRPASGGAGGGR